MSGPEANAPQPEQEPAKGESFGEIARARSDAILLAQGQIVEQPGGGRRRQFAWSPQQGAGVERDFLLWREETEHAPVSDTEYVLEMKSKLYDYDKGVYRFSISRGLHSESQFPPYFLRQPTHEELCQEVLDLLDTALKPGNGTVNHN